MTNSFSTCIFSFIQKISHSSVRDTHVNNSKFYVYLKNQIFKIKFKESMSSDQKSNVASLTNSNLRPETKNYMWSFDFNGQYYSIEFSQMQGKPWIDTTRGNSKQFIETWSRCHVDYAEKDKTYFEMNGKKYEEMNEDSAIITVVRIYCVPGNRSIQCAVDRIDHGKHTLVVQCEFVMSERNVVLSKDQKQFLDAFVKCM